MLAGRAVTLLLVQLPRRMAEVVVALAQVLQQRALAVAEAASAQKGRRLALLGATARAEVVMVVHRQQA